MKWINTLLVVLLIYLQSRLWFGEGSYAEAKALRDQLASQLATNATLEQRNQRLRTEVQALKHGLDSVEARARRDLGMIRQGETFYLVLN